MDHTVKYLEFSRPLDVSELPTQGLDISVEATPAECRALCRRFELEDLRTLAAQVRVERARDKDGAPTIRVRAVLRAQAEQICVVTLEPFAVQVDDEFTILFQLAANLPEGAGALDDAKREVSPEPLDTPEIDVGELVAQHLLLALDPHPRRPGAMLESGGEEAQSSDIAARPNGPFAKLGQLKHKM